MTARHLAFALLALGAAQGASAASYSTLLDVSNDASWQDPAWAEVTIEDDNTKGAGGIKFTVNLCDNEISHCSGGDSIDYGSGQNTIEQFGFNFVGVLSTVNISGQPDGWVLHSNEVMDGFGNFLYALSRGPQADTVEPLVFWILADGDAIGDYAQIGSTGGQPHEGALFSAKLGAGAPGAFIGGGTPVPVPGTLGLLGLGVAALGMIRRRS